MSKDGIASAPRVDLAVINRAVLERRFEGARSHDDAYAAIRDVVANFVGCEEVAIYRAAPDGSTLAPVAVFGVDPGDPGEPLCRVPLVIEGRTAYVVALFRMLAQKPHLERADHELLDALARCAAAALSRAEIGDAGNVPTEL